MVKHFVPNLQCSTTGTTLILSPPLHPAGPTTVVGMLLGVFIRWWHARLGRSSGCPSLPLQAASQSDKEVGWGESLQNQQAWYALSRFVPISPKDMQRAVLQTGGSWLCLGGLGLTRCSGHNCCYPKAIEK